MFDRSEDMVRELADATSRVFIGVFGLGWVGFCFLVFVSRGINRWPDEPISIFQEFFDWYLIMQGIAGLLVLVLSCLTLRLLHFKCVRWSSIVIFIFVGFGVAHVVYFNFHRIYVLYQSEPPDFLKAIHSERIARHAVTAGIFAILGIAFPLAAIRLVRRSKNVGQA